LENYVTFLFESKLPFEPWFAAPAWVVLFLANHWIVRRGLEPKYIVAKILFAGIVFLFALLLGGSAFVFFAGGLIVAMACGLALNVQGLLSARALARPNAVNGSLTFSTASAFRHMAHRVSGGALACLLVGLALAHLALLGGALFLASTASGYLHRARSARAQP
jgi:hypothetical protein